jgi:hypothetical protein
MAKSGQASRRFHWVLLSALLFLGIYAGNLPCCNNSHFPQRVASRAIGANGGLSVAVQMERPSPVVVFDIVLLAFVANLFVFPIRKRRSDSPTLRKVISSVWLPPLLFRPPPVSLVSVV